MPRTRDLLYPVYQITFIVTSPQHKCLDEWNSWEHAPESPEIICIYIGHLHVFNDHKVSLADVFFKSSFSLWYGSSFLIMTTWCHSGIVYIFKQLRASISTGPRQKNGTFYEFRTYFIQPHLNSAFLKLTNEKIALRTACSELLGYWTVEYGGLNQVFHIWKYGENFTSAVLLNSATFFGA